MGFFVCVGSSWSSLLPCLLFAVQSALRLVASFGNCNGVFSDSKASYVSCAVLLLVIRCLNGMVEFLWPLVVFRALLRIAWSGSVLVLVFVSNGLPFSL